MTYRAKPGGLNPVFRDTRRDRLTTVRPHEVDPGAFPRDDAFRGAGVGPQQRLDDVIPDLETTGADGRTEPHTEIPGS